MEISNESHPNATNKTSLLSKLLGDYFDRNETNKLVQDKIGSLILDQDRVTKTLSDLLRKKNNQQ
jgi:hypothetical protein